MENISDTLMESYLFETGSLIEQLDELLLSAEETRDFSQDNVNEIFRSMHTIKGSSAMMDFKPLMEISHHVEDLFFDIRENGTGALTDELKTSLFDLLFKCVDRLREDIGKIEAGITLNEDVSEFVNEIEGFLHKMKGTEPEVSNDTSSQASAPILPDVSANSLFTINVRFNDEGGMEHLRAFMLASSINEHEITFTTFPENVEQDSSNAEIIANQGFLIMTSEEEAVQTIVDCIGSFGNVESYEVLTNPDLAEEQSRQNMQNLTGSSSQAEPPKAELAPPVSDTPPQTEAKKPETEISNQIKTLNQSKQSLISVNLSKLDKLMAIVGEIVITESMVAASPELKGVKLDSFLKSERQLRKLTGDLQDIAMSLRMVPVSGVFQKMNRIVRDMTKTLKKDVRLVIIGEETEVDKSIVDNIADPIMHIVRNAMDHGIEDTEDERIAAGKDPQGEIILAARHTGSEVVITISNDGADMNTDKILAKASKKGLLTKPEEEYSKKEILALLMLPGFSTNAQVTEYSGRGVGLDVVKRNVEAIGGNVTISSEPGEGCAFTLKIPLTLAIVDGMEISVGGNIFTIPISNIRQSFKVRADEVVLDTSGNEMLSCMGEFYPMIRLNRSFDMEDISCTNVDEGIIIWVESSDKSYCLFVDSILGEQQVVVKPLPPYLNNFNVKKNGISGCTILGNGNISIILDVDNLYSATLGR